MAPFVIFVLFNNHFEILFEIKFCRRVFTWSLVEHKFLSLLLKKHNDMTDWEDFNYLLVAQLIKLLRFLVKLLKMRKKLMIMPSWLFKLESWFSLNKCSVHKIYPLLGSIKINKLQVFDNRCSIQWWKIIKFVNLYDLEELFPLL